jgi:hypothetical protein
MYGGRALLTDEDRALLLKVSGLEEIIETLEIQADRDAMKSMKGLKKM